MPAPTGVASPAPLEEILITHLLPSRPPRAPDTQGQLRAFRRIGAAFSGPPEAILQTLVEAALELSRGGTAGLSMLRRRYDGSEFFAWDALAGALSAYVGGATPRDFSPCGTTLDRGCPQLFDRPGRRFTYFQACNPEILEGLVVPIFSAHGEVGTLWVVSHDPDRHFDLEDVRIFSALAAFTAAGLEAARLQQSERRAREAAERTAERLNQRTQELERSNADLEDFAYICAHDLKEPLRGIRNYISFLREDHAIPAAANDKLGTIERLAARMSSLLDDLLDYSRVGRTELAVRPTDLNEILAGVLETLRPRIEQERADISIETPLPVLACDAPRIGQVFANLIANALKYNTSPRKRIAIGARPSTGPGSPPVIYIRDNGIGIPQMHADRIFRMFKRLHAREEFGGGTGSGLAIARRIIDRHHGRIWVEPNHATAAGAERGSTFCFTVAAPEEAPPGEDGPLLFDLLDRQQVTVSPHGL